jgi:prolyl 4-hydroxylase
MVYVQANCTGGGTHFPKLQRPVDRSWCAFIECEPEKTYASASPSAETNSPLLQKGEQRKKEDLNAGVIFKPIAGNAVYWENMRSDGSGYAESWHAGLPVVSGSKIGLNIWSWLAAGYVPPELREEKEMA